MDTIFALATAQGKAGIAVIRLSGPAAFGAAEQLIGPLPGHHRAALRILRAPSGEALDQGLVITFPKGHSFTGEDTVEFQLHGSMAIIKAVISVLSALPGLRLAEPGEFTRRALENNRLDLTQVEGLADLIDAETEAQRQQAQRVLSGAIGALADRWRADLVRATALLEATIDFADEDVPVDVSPEALSLLDRTLADLRAQVQGSESAERLRDSFEVAIVGPPNVGKSTLLNTLAGREAAITSEIAGTTRDVIEVRMDIEGLPVVILDTAGLRDTVDPVEQIGVARARERAAAADLRVVLLETPDAQPDISLHEDDIILLAKNDLQDGERDGISGKTGQGVDRLIKRIALCLHQRASRASLITRERQKIAVMRGIEALEAARVEVCEGPDRAELAAENLRAAMRSLDMLVGRVGVEDILDEIFTSFCLGK